MVHNLVGNALAHTPAGTPVEVGVAAQGDRAVLQVRDHGPGMTDGTGRATSSTGSTGATPTASTGAPVSACSSWPAWPGPSEGVPASMTAPGEGSTFKVVLPALSRRARTGTGTDGNVRRHRCWHRLTGGPGRGPPVLLLHGQPGTGASWDPLTDRLGARVPGAGPRPARLRRLGRRGPGSVRQRRAAGRRSSRERGAAPATVVAHSWSGGVAVPLADRHRRPGPGPGAGRGGLHRRTASTPSTGC